MEQSVIEREDPFEEATPAEEVKVAEPLKQPEAPVEEKVEEQPSPQEEAVVEIDGQKVTARELKEWQEAHKNKSEWQKSNTLKAQQIAAERKELEEAAAINTLLKSKPELKQKIFAPEPERDFDTELKAHYGRRPEVYGEDYIRWEYERDRLVADQAGRDAYKRAQAENQQTLARQHNDNVVNTAYDKYKGKVNDEEFKGAAEWVLKNIRADQNMYPQNSFDVAMKVLYGDRELTDAKINSVKSVIRSIEKAKPASGEQGTLKTTEKSSPEDEADDAFAAEVKARMHK